MSIEDWIRQLDLFMDASMSKVMSSVLRAQRELWTRIIEVLADYDATDGRLKMTKKNLAKLNGLDRIWSAFMFNEFTPIALDYAGRLIDVTGKNAEYYLMMGMNRSKVERIAADLSLIEAKVGFTAGQVKDGGFLSQLVQSAEAKQSLKDYIVNALASGMTTKQFTDGAKNLIVGNKDKDGVLASFWNRYAYDAMNQVREISNLHYADELGLEYFIYTGGIIRTSRDFCEKKNGKVFSRKDAEKWRDDPDLIEPSTKARYNPLIDRGRYNCRHFIAWISNEEAERRLKNARTGD